MLGIVEQDRDRSAFRDRRHEVKERLLPPPAPIRVPECRGLRGRELAPQLREELHQGRGGGGTHPECPGEGGEGPDDLRQPREGDAPHRGEEPDAHGARPTQAEPRFELIEHATLPRPRDPDQHDRAGRAQSRLLRCPDQFGEDRIAPHQLGPEPSEGGGIERALRMARGRVAQIAHALEPLGQLAREGLLGLSDLIGERLDRAARIGASPAGAEGVEEQSDTIYLLRLGGPDRASQFRRARHLTGAQRRRDRALHHLEVDPPESHPLRPHPALELRSHARLRHEEGAAIGGHHPLDIALLDRGGEPLAIGDHRPRRQLQGLPGGEQGGLPQEPMQRGDRLAERGAPLVR